MRRAALLGGRAENVNKFRPKTHVGEILVGRKKMKRPRSICSACVCPDPPSTLLKRNRQKNIPFFCGDLVGFGIPVRTSLVRVSV